MANVKVTLNKKGVRELLKSQEMMDICREHAEKIKDRCGEGYTVNTYRGKNRVNAMIYPYTQDAYADTLENNTILKAVHND